jgi:hypothetical protein
MRAQTVRGACALALVGALVLGAVAVFAPKVLIAVVVLFVVLAAIVIASALYPVSPWVRGIDDARDSGEGEEISRTRDSGGELKRRS